MAAINKVIAGDFEGKMVVQSHKSLTISSMVKIYTEISKETVDFYEVVDAIENNDFTPEGRKLMGAFILGATGPIVAQAAMSKGKHLVAIQFKDGKKSLISVEEKLYNTLQAQLA